MNMDLCSRCHAGIENSWNDEDPPGGELADDVGFIDALTIEIKAIFPEIPRRWSLHWVFQTAVAWPTRLACESNEIRGVGVMGNDYVAGPMPAGDRGTPQGPAGLASALEDDVVSVNAVRDSIPNYLGDLTNCSPMGVL